MSSVCLDLFISPQNESYTVHLLKFTTQMFISQGLTVIWLGRILSVLEKITSCLNNLFPGHKESFQKHVYVSVGKDWKTCAFCNYNLMILLLACKM